MAQAIVTRLAAAYKLLQVERPKSRARSPVDATPLRRASDRGRARDDGPGIFALAMVQAAFTVRLPERAVVHVPQRAPIHLAAVPVVHAGNQGAAPAVRLGTPGARAVVRLGTPPATARLGASHSAHAFNVLLPRREVVFLPGRDGVRSGAPPRDTRLGVSTQLPSVRSGTPVAQWAQITQYS